MPTSEPLQLILFRYPSDADAAVARFEEAMIRAFQGGKDAGPYLATGDDLGIQCRILQAAPEDTVSELLRGFCHTVVVVLLDENLLQKSEQSLWDWLSDYWSEINNSEHSLLMILPMEERFGQTLLKKGPELKFVQLTQVHSLGEHAVRPAMFALRLLHECRILLADALIASLSSGGGHLKLFISHAKMDGLPLAQALRHQIKSLGWLQGFYDADDLPPGRNWARELEKGVGSSVIVMLRTDEYDGRPWCQQEVIWADEYATPAVLVDARTNLSHGPSRLPFERVPAVRIPDGNLLRILFLALREGLRFLVFMRTVEQMKYDADLKATDEIRVFSFPPSIPALLKACASLNKAAAGTKGRRIILYPDLPPLRAGVFEAAQVLVDHYSSGTLLTTPNRIAATKGGAK